MKIKNNQQGFVVLLNTFLVLVFMLGLAMSMTLLIFNRQKISTNTTNAVQSYYASQAGAEDALLRLKNNPQMGALSYSMSVNNATANVTIPAIIGGSRTINSQGSNKNLIKTAQLQYTLDGTQTAFYYGAQVGAGGLIMGSNSTISGNVFSNGNISGSGNITGNAVVAGNGNSIKDVNIAGNALAYSCLSPARVTGNLTYVTGGSHTCTVTGATSSQSSQIASQPLPITQSQIDDWKAETASGNAKSAYVIGSNQTVNENSSVVITGNMSIGSNATWNLLGTTKIIGNLTVGSNAQVNLSGILYVTGNINFGSNSVTRLNSSYGSSSGLVISDGDIDINSNAGLSGSGQTGSYILILSTSLSNSAIEIGSNATGAIFYTSNGGVQINSNASLREVTGYKVTLGSNATLTYESGLANVFFANGPSGGWKVTNWQEK